MKRGSPAAGPETVRREATESLAIALFASAERLSSTGAVAEGRTERESWELLPGWVRDYYRTLVAAILVERRALVAVLLGEWIGAPEEVRIDFTIGTEGPQHDPSL